MYDAIDFLLEKELDEVKAEIVSCSLTLTCSSSTQVLSLVSLINKSISVNEDVHEDLGPKTFSREIISSAWQEEWHTFLI